MQHYYGYAKAISNGTPSEQVTTLVTELKAGARVHWWPTLMHLRKAKHYDSSQRHLLDLWKGFGGVLGLDISQERQRHEEEARTRCSWYGCPRRGQSADDQEAPNLRKCAGCGEVRYCSRECQMRYASVDCIAFARLTVYRLQRLARGGT